MNHLRKVDFLGIGGIGMSALARYFHARGVAVSGYDRQPTELTRRLEAEGIAVRYAPEPERLAPDVSLVVYTPAVASDHPELVRYRELGLPVKKRAQVLGELTASVPTIGIAGSHGKTTITTLVAHLLTQSPVGCAAFLGGIAANYGTNYLDGGAQARFVVVEADEYDRSFLTLHPDLAVVTSTDDDHLDIYGTPESALQAFVDFAGVVKPQGRLVCRHGIALVDRVDRPLITYGWNAPEADVWAENVRQDGVTTRFDLATRHGEVGAIRGLALHIPGKHNLDNALAALTVARLAGAEAGDLREALGTFRGVGRRFEFVLHTPELSFIDDYAHHPEELRAALGAARELFAGHHLTALFQPHLYSRTRDHAQGFAQALSMADQVLVTPIYPAREQPMEGVSSQLILEHLAHHPNARLVSPDEVASLVPRSGARVLLMMGAGDICNAIGAIREELLPVP